MSSTPREISHSGRIVEITPSFTTVEIVSESACSTCHAAGLCGVSEAEKKAVQVPTTLGGWSVGQEVDVVLKRSMGHKAVWIAYVGPLLVLVAVMLALLGLGLSEPLAGLCGIAAVAVYYLVVWMLRDSLRKEYTFYIKEK